MKYLLTLAALTAASPAFAHHDEEAGAIAAMMDHAPVAALLVGVAIGLFALGCLRRSE